MGSQPSAENSVAPLPTPTYPSFANDDQRPEMFSPRGSPPLIIAFLAIGLFSIAMLLVCGWQRVRVASGWILPTPATSRAGGRGNFKGERLGEKPQLWDVRIAYPEPDTHPADNEDDSGLHGKRSEGEVQKGMRWKDITPLSATICWDERSQSLLPLNKAETPTEARLGISRIIHRMYPGDGQEPRMSGTSSVMSENDDEKGVGAGGKLSAIESDNVQLRVAVVVAMPSPRTLNARRDPEPLGNPGRVDNELSYAIGLVQVEQGRLKGLTCDSVY
ncbi:hypothetical protein PLEOSDRAFT_154169 [Pleurotus ostreatus PC15]|uniref:Uncharacterized protein n=1 Tax=Pleurotus ostreatus (strain PC15) TaxID=1137138 RepID=A0A067P7T8_PLEO1|nr:hypothetical protein PLEOSDRAFT_154169 [Pleurotus ostreatus PC15]